MSTDEYKDIFKKSCLIQLSSSIWQCSRTIEQGLMNKVVENGTAEWLKGRKYLVNPELLGPIRSVVNAGRKTIQRHALPFPIQSIYLTPKESLGVIDKELTDLKNKFWAKVGEFEAIYGSALEEAQQKLGDLFNASDYPAEIHSKFGFEWRFLVLGLPGKNSILTPEIYQREKDKFENLMDETRELAIIALREEFSGLLAFLVERLCEDENGAQKKLKDGMFNKLNEFMNYFQTRNLFQDNELASIIEQTKGLISGVSTYNVKYNGDLRANIHNEMNALKVMVDAAIEDMPRRRIRMDVATE